MLIGTPWAVPEHFLSRPRRAYWAGISLLGVVALMALVMPTEPLRLDQRWSEAMRDIRTPLLTHLALVFNALGRGLGWALSLTAVGVVLYARRRLFALLVFAATEAVTSLSSTLLKILVGRPRPPDGLVHPVGSSFPLRSRRLRRRDLCRARPTVHGAWTAPSLVVGTRGTGSPWDGVEPHRIFRCTGSPMSSADRCSGSGSCSPCLRRRPIAATRRRRRDGGRSRRRQRGG